ncbi:MAG: hypothetical protein C5B52_14705 [Bacteroidetes bacterium]|nr:MAG: hypothetical protein C5B52_14705 [Bacteroidota bacterium]
MNINRNNYEEFFLLYVDNELSAAERRAVEEFVGQNPDLSEEWETYLQTKLIADDHISFPDKNILFRDSSEITLANYEEYLLSYVDGELNNNDKRLVEDFLVANPKLQSELEWMKRAKLDPADEMVFADKQLLYRKEETAVRLVVMRWWRVAAAASVILMAGLFWLNTSNRLANSSGPIVASTDKKNSGAKSGEIKTSGINDNNSKDKSSVKESTENAGQIAAVNENRTNPKKSKEISKVREEKSVKNDEPQAENKAVAAVETNNLPKIETVPNTDASNTVAVREQAQTKIGPTIIDVTSSKEETNNLASNAVYTNDQGVTYLETDGSDKKPKGKIRTLFRKAARFVDRVTNPEFDEKKSVVRVANIQLSTQ